MFSCGTIPTGVRIRFGWPCFLRLRVQLFRGTIVGLRINDIMSAFTGRREATLGTVKAQLTTFSAVGNARLQPDISNRESCLSGELLHFVFYEGRKVNRAHGTYTQNKFPLFCTNNTWSFLLGSPVILACERPRGLGSARIVFVAWAMFARGANSGVDKERVAGLWHQ